MASPANPPSPAPRADGAAPAAATTWPARRRSPQYHRRAHSRPPDMSTPTSLELPEGTRRSTVETARGQFAALDAMPAAGPCELGTALLVPGYTGSKEDFTAILGQLAAAGRRVIAVDQRGQYQTAGPDDPDAYDARELGADVAALVAATQATHLLGHSFAGLAHAAELRPGRASGPPRRGSPLHAELPRRHRDSRPEGQGRRGLARRAQAGSGRGRRHGSDRGLPRRAHARQQPDRPRHHGHPATQGRGQDHRP